MTEVQLTSLEAATPADVALPLSRRAQGLRIDELNVVVEAGQAALVWFSLLVVFGSQHAVSQAALLAITLATAVWLVALRSTLAPGRLVLGRAVSSSVGTVTGLVVVAAVNSSPVGLNASFPLLLGLALAVFGSTVVWGSVADRTLAAKRRVLLVGTESVGELLTEELRTSRTPRFDVVGAVPGSEELAEIVEAQRPDFVVLTDEATYGQALERLLDARSDVRVAGLENFFEYAFGRVPVDQISPAWFMSLLHPRQRMYTRLAKRTFDIVFALTALVLAAPLMGVLALLTKTSRGPVLYRQTRMGEDGRPFTILKFRTMRCDAERDGAAFAGHDDPRATRVGRYVRRTHLDELPQLWNVLKGDMSIVGPRPERPEFIEMIEATVPFWSRRLLVKPGITGWAQVRCGYAADCEAMETKLSYDLWYLRNRSLLVDLAVCVMTVFSVLGRPART